MNLDMRIINVTYIYWQAVAYAAIYLLILQGINLSYIYFVGENIGAQMMLVKMFRRTLTPNLKKAHSTAF